jgi:tetratricopeptide (TPR) repeat protein
MSRFSNLEFEDGFDSFQQDQTLLKDDAFYLKEARLGFENAKFEYALRAYAKVLEFNPMNAAAWAGQVQMLIELEEYREAKLERGESPIVWLARADVLMARKETMAEYSIQRAIVMAPEDWLVHVMTSKIYYFYKYFLKAFKSAKKATELAPSVPICWLQLGICQLELGMNSQAHLSFQSAIELSPSNREIENMIRKYNHKRSHFRGFLRKIFGR